MDDFLVMLMKRDIQIFKIDKKNNNALFCIGAQKNNTYTLEEERTLSFLRKELDALFQSNHSHKSNFNIVYSDENIKTVEPLKHCFLPYNKLILTKFCDMLSHLACNIKFGEKNKSFDLSFDGDFYQINYHKTKTEITAGNPKSHNILNAVDIANLYSGKCNLVVKNGKLEKHSEPDEVSLLGKKIHAIEQMQNSMKYSICNNFTSSSGSGYSFALSSGSGFSFSSSSSSDCQSINTYGLSLIKPANFNISSRYYYTIRQGK